MIAPNVCVPVNVCAASVRAMVAEVVGNVSVVASVPARVRLLENVSVLAAAPVSVHVPVVSVLPLMVLPVRADAILPSAIAVAFQTPVAMVPTDVSEDETMAAGSAVPARFAAGKPVVLVSVPLAGVPSVGVTSVGLFQNAVLRTETSVRDSPPLIALR